jgi:hypothetical protein
MANAIVVKVDRTNKPLVVKSGPLTWDLNALLFAWTATESDGTIWVHSWWNKETHEGTGNHTGDKKALSRAHRSVMAVWKLLEEEYP